jgi:hypothetical protein
MTVLGLQRMRVGYEKGNRPAIWLLLALFVFVLASRHLPALVLVGRLDDELLQVNDVLAALPVLLAVVTLLVAPARRLLIAGSVALAAAAALFSIGRLAPLLPGELGMVIGSLGVPLLVAGPLMFGRGLGGVASRRGSIVVAVGSIVAGAAAGFAFSWVRAALRLAGHFDGLLLATSVLHQFTYLAWAYVLGAALEPRAALIAAGAGLFIAAEGTILMVDVVAVFQPGFVLPEAWVVYLGLSLAAWAALIVGVIREVDGKGMVASHVIR